MLVPTSVYPSIYTCILARMYCCLADSRATVDITDTRASSGDAVGIRGNMGGTWLPDAHGCTRATAKWQEQQQEQERQLH